MKKIFKCVLNKRVKTVEINGDFKILTAQKQNNDISVWFEVNTDTDVIPVQFMLIRTDEEIPEGFEYINSIQMPDEGDGYPFLYHVYYKV